MKIYIVMGMTGEYSDHTEWLVCAYKTEEEAKHRVIELELLLKSHGVLDDGNRIHGVLDDGNRIDFKGLNKVREIIKKLPDGDESFQCDYTGTQYYYEETELK